MNVAYYTPNLENAKYHDISRIHKIVLDSNIYFCVDSRWSSQIMKVATFKSH